MSDAGKTVRFLSDAEQAGFVQVPNVVLLSGLSDGAKLTYAMLVHHARQDETCWPGLERLGAMRGKSERQIRTQITELKKSGLVAVTRKGQGRPNTYRLVPLSDVDLQFLTGGKLPVLSGDELPVQTGEKLPPKKKREEEAEEEQEAASSLMSTEERKRVAVRNVFDHWKTTYAPRAVFDRKRGSRINARLEERMHGGETVQDAEAALMRAITNAERDDWLAGRAERSGDGYLKKLDTLLRDAAQVERLLELSPPADEKAENYDEEAEHEAELRALRGEEPLVPDDDTPPPVAA